MVNVSDKDYFEKSSVLRARQSWKKELKAEKLIEQEYQMLLEKVNAEVAGLFVRYSTEGLVDYSRLRMNLTPSELNMYKRNIQEIINQNKDIDDEEILAELDKLKNYNSVTVLDSKMNAVEAHTLTTISKSTEIISESLLETQEDIESYTSYDIQRKKGVAKPVNKKKTAVVLLALMSASGFTGLTYPEALKDARHRLLRDVKRKVSTGIKRGEGFSKLSTMLDKEVMGGKGRMSTANILRGETTRVIADTALEVYEEAGLDQYEFVATLDDRTTEVCQDLDGEVFYIKDAEEGVNKPKMHFGCRSTTAPYIPEDDLSESSRRARNPETNQNYIIPGNISYKEWNAKYNK